MWQMAVAAGLGGILGGVAGAQKDVVEQKSSSGIDLGRMSGRERTANQGVSSDYDFLRALVGAGPGGADVTASLGASRDLASMLEAFKREGGADPTANDISRSDSLADMLFKSQRVQMEQAFGDQTTQANRQAALMGRNVNDPILKAKLAQEQTRQSAMLGAQQGSWATQYAMQQPMQRLGFAEQLASVRGGLASQAMANRQALMAAGQGIQQNERNWRLAKAERWNTGEQSSGGGIKGAITGGLAGMSTGMSMMSGMGGMGAMGAGGGFGGGAVTPGQFMGNSSSANMGGFFGGASPYATPTPSFNQAPAAGFAQSSYFGQRNPYGG